MGQKLQCIHVGGFAALRNQLQVQHTNRKRSWGRSTRVTGREVAYHMRSLSRFRCHNILDTKLISFKSLTLNLIWLIEAYPQLYFFFFKLQFVLSFCPFIISLIWNADESKMKLYIRWKTVFRFLKFKFSE